MVFYAICSYRKANTRLRKMGRPELDDVTASRLTMRPDIEKEIESVISKCGFRRVTLEEVNKNEVDKGEGDSNTTNGSGKKQEDAITSWNRSIHLYERVV